MVFVICTKEGAKELLQYSGKYEIDVKNLIIIGGGRIGDGEKGEGSLGKAPSDTLRSWEIPSCGEQGAAEGL